MKEMTGPFRINLQETFERLRRRRRHSSVVSIREKVATSFEFFPPKDEAAGRRLDHTLDALERFEPSFVSVTYGAGGSARNRSARVVSHIASRFPRPVAAHLTCASESRLEVDEALDGFIAAGVRQFVALRGDLPTGADREAVERGGYRRSCELVAAIRRRGDYDVSVGTYPEKHPESTDLRQDIDALLAKQDAGATRAITQFFFDTDCFLRFRDQAVAAGVRIPIVPGVLPIHNFGGTRRFADGCGAVIPAWMDELFSGLDEAPEVRDMVATTVATEQCARLIEHGVEHLHFYTLNRYELTTAICDILGLGPRRGVGEGTRNGGLKRA